jgi:hypothetical protein
MIRMPIMPLPEQQTFSFSSIFIKPVISFVCWVFRVKVEYCLLGMMILVDGVFTKHNV